MLAKNKDGKQVEVPAGIVEMMEKQGITDFAARRRVVKAACQLELNPPAVEEQILNSGEWKKHTKKGAEDEYLYAVVPGATLPDGTTAQGIFVRAEIVPALYLELARLLDNQPK